MGTMLLSDDPMQRFFASLAELPRHVGVIWRGATSPLAGQTRAVKPVPATLDPRYAGDNFSVPLLLAIASRNARDLGLLAANQDEAELVLLPGTVLQPIGEVEQFGGVAVQLIEEVGAPGEIIPPGLPQSLEALRDEVEARIAQYRGMRHVDVASPRKYSGPLPTIDHVIS